MSVDSFLNDVNITSNIRAPGEYKYYYCGENNSESDKSFLVISTMSYTERVTEDMELKDSCYNYEKTAQIYYNNKTNVYNILIYQNIIDYHNENIVLKLIQQINLATNIKTETMNNKNESEKNLVKIFFVSNNYIILNEIDNRILLIEIDTGNFITIFSKTSEEKETIYNIIDTYDETYVTEGEQRIRTYVFLSKKNQERKTPTYSYKYFIVQRSIFKMKAFFLHSIDFDLGNSEPIGLKIAKIINPNTAEKNFMYIFIFMSSSTIVQLITDYGKDNLHHMLKKHSRVNNNNQKKKNEFKNNMDYNESGDSEFGPNSSRKLNLLDEDGLLKTRHWITKKNVDLEKKQFSQSIKIALNINNKKICAFIIFIESKRIVSYNFNYTDSPEEIKDKIFLTSNINLRLDDRNFDQMFRQPAKLFKFTDNCLLKTKCFFGYTNKNLIIGDNSKIYIYEINNQHPVYTYEFFNETLSTLLTFDGLGSTFLLTGTKLFKIIYNDRYNCFSNEKILRNDKIFVHYYNNKQKMGFPIFEYQPEDIWNSYCSVFGIEPITNLTIQELRKMNSKKMLNLSTSKENSQSNESEEENFEEEYFNFIPSTKEVTVDKSCALCGKMSEKCCSDCNIRFYCCNEHFRYDYYNFHFFECQLIQFFNRKDIITIRNKEIRYKVLYNELIKVAGRILTFIFKRIYCKNDYHYFLKMIISLIEIMDNFGFGYNLTEFCEQNFISIEGKKNRPEKIIFYQEAIYYYVQLNLLKCTFALKSGLYNLTDCYLKIIKNEIIPLLTPKIKRKLANIKLKKSRVEMLYNNDYFNEFDSELFFDVTKYEKNSSNGIDIDLVEEYIVKNLMSISLLVKFKKKIKSSIEVHNSFVDIYFWFVDHYNETEYKNIVSYCFFFTCIYLVEIGKVPQAIKLYKKIVSTFTNTERDNNKLKALTYYNLGLLQYALEKFDYGIHNIEKAYKLIVENKFSDKIRLKVIDTLGLAYLNRRNLFKSYILLQNSIQERKKLDKKNNEIICTKLNVYLNYIIDLYEYTFISKARLLIKKKYNNSDKRQLIKFVLSEDDKELVISEENIEQFIKVVEFVWNLKDDVLKILNADNPPKIPTNSKDEHHTEKNLSFNSDLSMTSTFMFKDNNNYEKEDLVEEYEEDIEVKTNVYEFKFDRRQQQAFKQLKTIYLKRDIILRDSLGDIEKFNINYDPIYAVEFHKIIEKLKSNFLLKEIFYCFQNEKWRDELYNYNPNNILFGLSKYLKLEKIQNMMAIEKTKIMQMRKQEKLKQKILRNSIYQNNPLIESMKNELIKKSNINNNLNDNRGVIEEDENEINTPSSNIFSNSYSTIKIEKENEKNENENENDKNKPTQDKNMDYQSFKEKFVSALKELEKDKKNEDLYDFLNFDEDYLYNLYTNVYKNNPDYELIFQNPLLILNYIFIEINKQNDKELKKNLIQQAQNQEISLIQEEEKRNSFSSSMNNKKDEDQKKDENKEEEKKDINIDKNTNNNNINNNSIFSSSFSAKSKHTPSEGKDKDKDKEKEKENSLENRESSEEENSELNRMNSFTKKFILSQLAYNYSLDEISETREQSFSLCPTKKGPPEFTSNTLSKRTTTRRKDREKAKDKNKIQDNELFNFSKGVIESISPKKKLSSNIDYKDVHRTFIEEADKIFMLSKVYPKIPDFEKTFANIQKQNRLKYQNEINNTSNNHPFSKRSMDLNGHPLSHDRKSKSKKKFDQYEKDNNLNYLKNKNIDYLPFINKRKKSERNKNPKKNSKNKKNKDTYFSLAKEMKKSPDKSKKRGHSTDINFQEPYYGVRKVSPNKNTLNIKSFYDEGAEEEKNAFNDYPIYKKKNNMKNSTYHFKTKDEREKELEHGAQKYLKNSNKNKYNSMFSSTDTVPIKKKRITKSTDIQNKGNKKRKDYENNLEINKYLKDLMVKNENQNRNKKCKNKKVRYNSSSTINSSFSDYNNYDFLYNNLINKNNNKKKKNDIFDNEYKKIMEYNKKRRYGSQDNNNNNNYNNQMYYNSSPKNNFGNKTDINKYDYFDEGEHLCTDFNYAKNDKCGYHGTTHLMPKKYTCNFKECPANDDKKISNIYNPKIYNMISSTNNTDTSKNTAKKKKNQNTKNTKTTSYPKELFMIK